MWLLWRRFALLGMPGVGLYTTLQYLALRTSSPINLTLVAASMPVWTVPIGAMFFKTSISSTQIIGPVVSIGGVLIVLSRGDLHTLLALRLVSGDILMIIAAIVWSFYSRLLTLPVDPVTVRNEWAAFLLAQIAFGVM